MVVVTIIGIIKVCSIVDIDCTHSITMDNEITVDTSIGVVVNEVNRS